MATYNRKKPKARAKSDKKSEKKRLVRKGATPTPKRTSATRGESPRIRVAPARKSPGRAAAKPAHKPSKKPGKPKRTGAKRPTEAKRPVVKRPASKKPVLPTRPRAFPKKVAAKALARKPSARPQAPRPRAFPKKVAAKALRSNAAKKAAATRRAKAAEHEAKLAARREKARLRREKARADVARRQRQLDKLEAERQKNRRKRGSKNRPTKADVKERRKNVEEQGKKEFERKKRKTRRPIEEEFERLLEIAREKNQLPKLPPQDKRHHRYRTEFTEGQKLGVVVNDYVNEETVEEILYNIEQQAKRMPESIWPLWMARFDFTFMGERLIGYGMRVLVDPDPMASTFYTQGVDSTGAWNSKRGMMLRLRSELEELASEQNTVVYLNHVVLQNFKRTR